MNEVESLGCGSCSSHMRAVADALPCMLFETDAQGAHVWSNEAWVRYTGLPRSELAASGWRGVLHPDDGEQGHADWARAVDSAGEYRIRQRLRRHDGLWRWGLVHAAPLRNAAGGIKGWAGTVTDIDDIVRGEASLLEQARLAQFQLELEAALREAADAQGMMNTATALLGRHLAVAQVGYGEIDAAQARITVHRDWNDGRIPSVTGTWRMDDFGPAFAEDIKAGRTVAVPDIARDARTSATEVAAAYASIHTRSILDVPLVRQGRLMALLFIHHPEPRAWTRAEVSLVEEVCTRLWAAVERARAERVLAETTATLDLATVFLRDTTGRVLHWSKGCEHLYGWTAQEAVGRSTHELLRTVYPVPLPELQAALEREGEWTGQLRHTTRDGRELVISARKALRRDSQGQPTAVAEAVTDVTAAWQALAALERSNEQARLAAERVQLALAAGAIIGTWLWDLPTDAFTVDERFADSFGIDPGLGRTGLSLEQVIASVHPEDLQGLRAALADALKRGGAYSQEYRVRGRDGIYRWIEANGRVELAADGTPLRFPGVLLDIERRHALEAERDQAMELLRAFSEAVPGVVYAKDREGRMLLANAGATELIGKPPQVYLGRTDLEFLDDKAQATAVMATDRRIMDSGIPEQLEEIVSRPDGIPAVWLSTKAPFRDKQGRVIGLIGASLDITARKAAEARLAELNASLERRVQERTAELTTARDAAEAANRAKSAFLANMSHEIRTPMNAILGLAHLLGRDGLTPQQAEQLAKIEGAAQHLLSIINNILDLSRIEAGKLQLEERDFSLPALLEQVHSIAATSASAKGLAVEVHAGDVPVWLRGDDTRIRQALLNYASNAVKFTIAGRVMLRAEQLQQCQDGCVQMRFSVEDTGVGIDAQQVARLFEAFEQADASTTREHGGTGLGLVITRRLAELMDGSAGAQPRPGGGSIFWFTVWLQPGKPMEQPPAVTDAVDVLQYLRHSGARVLLAEDNFINREVAQVLLRNAGLEVDIAEDGQQVLEQLQQRHYDLVLMDMQMPVMDGLQATRALRAMPEFKQLPVLALTANAFSEDRAACLAAGMNDFISKPVEPQALYAALAKWLRASSAR